MVRLARLPTRVFADGSFARGVAVEGLYGLARLTVHEAELSLDSSRDPNAGGCCWATWDKRGRAGQRLWSGTCQASRKERRILHTLV